MEITEEPSRTDERDEDRAGGRKRGKRRAEKTPREVTDEKDAARGRGWAGEESKTHTTTTIRRVLCRWKMFLLITHAVSRRISRYQPVLLYRAGFSSLPENIIQPSFVLRKQGRGKRGGRNGRQHAAGMVVTLRALNIQLLYHEISARKLDNATLVGSPSGRGRGRGESGRRRQRIKEEENPRGHTRERRRARKRRRRSVQGVYMGGGNSGAATAASLGKCSHLITHAI